MSDCCVGSTARYPDSVLLCPDVLVRLVARHTSRRHLNRGENVVSGKESVCLRVSEKPNHNCMAACLHSSGRDLRFALHTVLNVPVH